MDHIPSRGRPRPRVNMRLSSPLVTPSRLPFCLPSVDTHAACSALLADSDALGRAVSREQRTIEVRFRDALGNVAHAEDLDVYVELARTQSAALGGDGGGARPASVAASGAARVAAPKATVAAADRRRCAELRQGQRAARRALVRR